MVASHSGSRGKQQPKRLGIGSESYLPSLLDARLQRSRVVENLAASGSRSLESDDVKSAPRGDGCAETLPLVRQGQHGPCRSPKAK